MGNNARYLLANNVIQITHNFQSKNGVARTPLAHNVTQITHNFQSKNRAARKWISDPLCGII